MTKLTARNAVTAADIQIFRMRKTLPLIWQTFFIALNAVIHLKTQILNFTKGIYMSLCEEGWVYECPLCGVRGRLEHYHDPETGQAAGEGEVESYDDEVPTMCFSCGGIFDFFALIDHSA